jgi:hypothetical protein
MVNERGKHGAVLLPTVHSWPPSYDGPIRPFLAHPCYRTLVRFSRGVETRFWTILMMPHRHLVAL